MALKKDSNNGKPLTKEEVQELRQKAKEYAKNGGKYLEKVKSNYKH